MSKQPVKRLEIQPVRYQQKSVSLNSSGNVKSGNQQGKKTSETQKKLPECKICKTLLRPGDLSKILNQGLYHKYTASLDFFYTRDINALIKKGKSPQYIKYKDDRYFDNEQEYLKYYYTHADSSELMNEIKNFYSQFHDYPRFFDQPHYRIISIYIRRHRKIEYIKVFKPSPEEMPPRESLTEISNNPSMNKSEVQFNLLELLDRPTSNTRIKESEQNTQQTSEKANFNKKVNDSMIDIEKNFMKLKELTKKEQNRPVPQLIGPIQLESEIILRSNNDSGVVTDIIGELNKPQPKIEIQHQNLMERVSVDNKTPIKRISIKKLNIKLSTDPNEAPLSTNRYKYIPSAQSERKIPQLRLQHSPTADDQSLERLVASTTKRGDGSPNKMIVVSKNRFYIKTPAKLDRESPQPKNHARQFTLPLNPYGFDSPTRELQDPPTHIKAATLKIDRQESTKNTKNTPEEEKDGAHFLRKEFQIRRNYLRSSSKINSNNSNNIVAPFSSPTSGASPTPEKYYLRTSKGESTERALFKEFPTQDLHSTEMSSRIKIITPTSLSHNLGVKAVVQRSRSKGVGSTTARTEASSEGPLRIVLNPTTLNNIKPQTILTHRPGISGGLNLNAGQRTSKSGQKIYISGNHNVNNIFIYDSSTERGASSTRASKTPNMKKSIGLPTKGSPIMAKKRF